MPDEEEMSFPAGYPQLTYEISDDSSLQVFRRFKRARLRVILAKQAHIMKLEKDLDRIDTVDEEKRLHGDLRSFRDDRNLRRKFKIRELERALTQYDAFIQRTHRAMNMPEPESRGLKNLKKLTLGGFDEDEMKYIGESQRELMYIGVLRGGGMGVFMPSADFIVTWLYFLWDKLTCSKPRDSIPKPLIRGVARVLAAILTIFVLLVPIIILNIVQRTVWKFVVIFVAAACFVSSLAVSSTASAGEVFVGGATYAAVLVVFVSQNGV